MGPDAELILHAAGRALSDRDAIAVHVVEGEPRAITVVLRYGQSGSDRSAEELRAGGHARRDLQEVLATVDAEYGARGDDVLVAQQGAESWAFAGLRRASSALRLERRREAIGDMVEAHLGAVAGQRRSLPSLALGAPIEGELGGPPDRPTTFLLELERDTEVVFSLALPESAEAFVELCRGEQNPFVCVDRSSLVPISGYLTAAMEARERDHSESGRSLTHDAYRLAAGSYTVVLWTECDYGAPCPSRGARFTLAADVLP